MKRATYRALCYRHDILEQEIVITSPGVELWVGVPVDDKLEARGIPAAPPATALADPHAPDHRHYFDTRWKREVYKRHGKQGDAWVYVLDRVETGGHAPGNGSGG